jgi:hypothetical protein
MSTKTTFKRVALVTVAALGFGMLSTVASSAAALTVGATSSISTDVSSITLVPASTTPATTDYAAFEVSLTNSSGYAAPLQTGETMTATVIATPGASRAGSQGGGQGATIPADLTLKWSVDYAPTTRLITTPSSTASPSTMLQQIAQPKTPWVGLMTICHLVPTFAVVLMLLQLVTQQMIQLQQLHTHSVCMQLLTQTS